MRKLLVISGLLAAMATGGLVSNLAAAKTRARCSRHVSATGSRSPIPASAARSSGCGTSAGASSSTAGERARSRGRTARCSRPARPSWSSSSPAARRGRSLLRSTTAESGAADELSNCPSFPSPRRHRCRRSPRSHPDCARGSTAYASSRRPGRRRSSGSLLVVYTDHRPLSHAGFLAVTLAAGIWLVALRCRSADPRRARTGGLRRDRNGGGLGVLVASLVHRPGSTSRCRRSSARARGRPRPSRVGLVRRSHAGHARSASWSSGARIERAPGRRAAYVAARPVRPRGRGRRRRGARRDRRGEEPGHRRAHRPGDVRSGARADAGRAHQRSRRRLRELLRVRLRSRSHRPDHASLVHELAAPPAACVHAGSRSERSTSPWRPRCSSCTRRCSAARPRDAARRRPVLYRQTRLGEGGQRFTIYKLRTMTRDAERDGAALAQPNDPRVTRVGRMLRRTHLDELPQLWNVCVATCPSSDRGPSGRSSSPRSRPRCRSGTAGCWSSPASRAGHRSAAATRRTARRWGRSSRTTSGTCGTRSMLVDLAVCMLTVFALARRSVGP